MLLVFTLQAFAQYVANTFQAVEKTNFSMQKLDEKYPPAISADSKKAVLKGIQQYKFIAAYSSMLNKLAVFLNNNNFKWVTPTRIFNRIYFAPNGRQQQFLRLLHDFITTNKIDITADSRFAQCSPVIYKDVK